MNLYQRLILISMIGLLGSFWRAPRLLAEPGIATRGELDSSNFPDVSVTVSGTCDNLIVSEGYGDSKSIQSPRSFRASRPTQVAIVLDITDIDQTIKPAIQSSITNGLLPYLAENGHRLNDNPTILTPYDRFSVFAPTATGMDSKQLISWTTSISDVVSSVTDFAPVDVSVTQLRNIISSTLNLFPSDEDASRALIIYTNGIDFADYPQLSGKEQQAVQMITDQLVQQAKDNNIQIHMVFYKGKYQNRHLLTEITDRTDGTYQNLSETPQLRQLWKWLFTDEDRCALTYTAQQVPPKPLIITRQQSNQSAYSTKPFTPTWNLSQLTPTLTITLPTTMITGSSAISLTGEQLISINITATGEAENESLPMTSTISVTKLTEISMPVYISWEFPGNLPISVTSLIVTLSANRSEIISGSEPGIPKISLVQAIEQLEGQAQPVEIWMPVNGLPYGEYHVSVLAKGAFGTGESSYDSPSLLTVNSPLPEPVVVLQKEGIIQEFNTLSQHRLWIMLGAIFALTTLLMTLYLVRKRRFVKGFELNPSQVTNRSMAFQIIPWVVPRSLLYRNTLQTDAQQVVQISNLEQGVKLGWFQHETMKQSPGFYDIHLKSESARGDAYLLTEKNGEFWVQQAKNVDAQQDWGVPQVISAGKEINLSKKMSYSFYPLQRKDG